MRRGSYRPAALGEALHRQDITRFVDKPAFPLSIQKREMEKLGKTGEENFTTGKMDVSSEALHRQTIHGLMDKPACLLESALDCTGIYLKTSPPVQPDIYLFDGKENDAQPLVIKVINVGLKLVFTVFYINCKECVKTF